MKEFRKDPIVSQFVDRDEAIICRDEPGSPLVMVESAGASEHGPQ